MKKHLSITPLRLTLGVLLIAAAFALVIGGNEGDSIRATKVHLKAKGLIKQRATNPFICVIKNLK